MDKYQESLMRDIRFEQYDTITSKGRDIVYENDTLKIVQDADITHIEYLVYIARNNSIISKVEIFENGEYKEPPQYTPIQFYDGSTFYRKDLVVKVNFDFQSITKIRVHFTGVRFVYLLASIEKARKICKCILRTLKNNFSPKNIKINLPFLMMCLIFLPALLSFVSYALIASAVGSPSQPPQKILVSSLQLSRAS